MSVVTLLLHLLFAVASVRGTSAKRADSGRFAMVPESVLYADLSDGAVRQYAVLRRHGDDPSCCFPSRTLLAKLQRCTISTVDRRMKELVAAGFVEVVPRFDDRGDQLSNGYWVFTDGGRNGAAGGSRRAEAGGGRNGAATPSRTAAALKESQVEREKPQASGGTAASARERLWTSCFNLLDELTGHTHEEGRLSGALKMILAHVRDEHDGDESSAPVEIRQRAAVFVRHHEWGEVPLTANGLANLWADLKPGGPLDPGACPSSNGADEGSSAC